MFYICRGVHPPLRPWCISPLFQISPLFSKNVQTLWKIFNILPFPEKFLDFHPPKFLMTFFSHRPQISKFPSYFLCFSTFPSYLAKIIISPLYFEKFPPLFSKNSPSFYILYVYFVSPYFDHDAFMHHPMRVLGAPAHYSLLEFGRDILYKGSNFDVHAFTALLKNLS